MGHRAMIYIVAKNDIQKKLGVGPSIYLHYFEEKSFLSLLLRAKAQLKDRTNTSYIVARLTQVFANDIGNEGTGIGIQNTTKTCEKELIQLIKTQEVGKDLKDTCSYMDVGIFVIYIESIYPFQKGADYKLLSETELAKNWKVYHIGASADDIELYSENKINEAIVKFNKEELDILYGSKNDYGFGDLVKKAWKKSKLEYIPIK